MEALLSSRKAVVDLRKHRVAYVEGEREIALRHSEGVR
jgi:hypothetical protein